MGKSKRGKCRSPTCDSDKPLSSPVFDGASTGFGLDGLLSQFSRFLMKNGESLAGAHVSGVVSGMAA